jgi:hypothetical protein
MNLFWAITRNVTALRRFESAHRFKTLPPGIGTTACFCEPEVDFAGTPQRIFPLREMGHAVSLIAFAAPTALQTSAV